MRIVVALGGNALLRRGEPMTVENQNRNITIAAAALAQLIEAGHRVIITHGNGPQVGLLALQAASGPVESAYPLDMLGAETEGMIGYLIEAALRRRLAEHPCVTLLTQIRVAVDDPAFQNPTKPIGPVYDEATAQRLARERNWQVAPDGPHWRRVVASPKPIEILEVGAIRLLAEHDITVICAGGGGIPVVRREDGSLLGVEAVIDKDLASSLLAQQLSADMLLFLTDVPGVYLNFKTRQQLFGRVSPDELDPAKFPMGSMGPKIAAAKEFVTATQRVAVIGQLNDAIAMVNGVAGTRIEPAAHIAA